MRNQGNIERKENCLNTATLMQEPASVQERRFWWHWQNLNEKKDGTCGFGLRHGRCWWNFRSRNKRPGPDICFEWNLWSRFCGFGVDIDDEDLTFTIAFPPFAFWLSFSTNFWLIDVLAPRKSLSPYYPDTIVIDERELSAKVHSGKVWLKFGASGSGWRCDHNRSDPWWKSGVNFSINHFEWRHMRHEVRCADYSRTKPPYHYWVPYVGSWEHDKPPDGRETLIYPYRYVLKNGTVQNRTATIYVERMAWRPRCLRWTSLFERERTYINITFDNEVGERTGSWKGGTTGCSWDLKPSEYFDPEQALRRMEKERIFN